MTKFMASRPNLRVGVTDKTTGQGLFINAKECRDPIDCIIESMSVPFLSRGGLPHQKGSRYIDGTIGNPLPLDFAIKMLHCTDILVGMNQPVTVTSGYTDLVMNILNRLTVNGTKGPVLFRAIATYPARYGEELDYLTGNRILPDGVRIAAIYPSLMPITTFTQDPNVLAEGMQQARDFTKDLFRSFGS